jgi:hypothetical protein
MRIFLQKNDQQAWKWITQGYEKAFSYFDFETIIVDDLKKIDTSKEYYIFYREDGVNDSTIDILKNSKQTYLYVQPNHFPYHWGQHPSWQCSVSKENITKLNSFDNIKKWTFCSDLSFFNLWNDVHIMPLAYDSISYQSKEVADYKYDICFIGGFADNGFNEKIKNMQEVLGAFIESGLKCGFSVNGNVSHEIENSVLNESKISLNIHDLYQRVVGLDSNERTFKSLGCNGLLLCDYVKQVKDLFPFCYCSNNPKDLIDKAREYCYLSINDLNEIKQKNKIFISENHTYIKRVEKFISLK